MVLVSLPLSFPLTTPPFAAPRKKKSRSRKRRRKSRWNKSGRGTARDFKIKSCFFHGFLCFFSCYVYRIVVLFGGFPGGSVCFLASSDIFPFSSRQPGTEKDAL